MAFLEDYTLLEELGQGAFATVYKVRHNKLGYIRAVRVLNKVISQGESDPSYQKFLEECILLLRLGNGNHPNIVHIYQPLLKDQHAVVEMDYVDGQDLYHYMDSHGSFVEIDEVMSLLKDIGGALGYCHEDIYEYCMDRDVDHLQTDPNDGSKVLIDEATKHRLIQKYQVVHNDLHPGNIMRKRNGGYILLDFGLAIEGNTVVRSSRKKNGVPEYKSPEKWRNESHISTQSDIYSFGVILYTMLAGRPPFMIDSQNQNSFEAEHQLYNAHINERPPAIYTYRKEAFEKAHPGQTYEKDYPDWLETLILKCLEKKEEDRFQSGKELYDFVQENEVKVNIITTPPNSTILTENTEHPSSTVEVKEEILPSSINIESVVEVQEVLPSSVQVESLTEVSEEVSSSQVQHDPIITKQSTKSSLNVFPTNQSIESDSQVNSSTNLKNKVNIYILSVLTLMIVLGVFIGWFFISGDNSRDNEIVVGPPIKTFTVNGVSFDMIKVQGDEFKMGSKKGESNESPIHDVFLSDYYLGETEVTQELWQAVMGNNPSFFKGEGKEKNPVESISWNAAQKFIKKLNQITGEKFRLPTEAEWEYAARGGNQSKGYTYSGGNTLSDLACSYENSQRTTFPVKQKLANEIGLFDMSGNVCEWCEDWYDKKYYVKSPEDNPKCTTETNMKIIRGGSWYSSAYDCRVADRGNESPQRISNIIGLRLAL